MENDYENTKRVNASEIFVTNTVGFNKIKCRAYIIRNAAFASTYLDLV